MHPRLKLGETISPELNHSHVAFQIKSLVHTAPVTLQGLLPRPGLQFPVCELGGAESHKGSLGSGGQYAGRVLWSPRVPEPGGGRGLILISPGTLPAMKWKR